LIELIDSQLYSTADLLRGNCIQTGVVNFGLKWTYRIQIHVEWIQRHRSRRVERNR